jgi:DNA-binding MarR family transcriptional regulator
LNRDPANMRKIDDSDAALAFELRETLSRGSRRIRVEQGPPLAQLTVLGHLERRGAMSTNDLAAAEQVRPQSMTTIVRSIEKAGLVRRRPHPTDGRTVLIELTAKGIKTLNSIFALREDWLIAVISDKLTVDERRKLRQGLTLIQRIIDTENRRWPSNSAPNSARAN